MQEYLCMLQYSQVIDIMAKPWKLAWLMKVIGENKPVRTCLLASQNKTTVIHSYDLKKQYEYIFKDLEELW